MHTRRQWALQDAKAQFSKVVKQAKQDGPQIISVYGEPAVVMLSQEDYLALITPKETLVQFLQRSPLVGTRLTLKRDKSLARDIDL